MAIVKNKKPSHRRAFWFGGVKHEVTAEADTLEKAENETYAEQEKMIVEWKAQGVHPDHGLMNPEERKAKAEALATIEAQQKQINSLTARIAMLEKNK